MALAGVLPVSFGLTVGLTTYWRHLAGEDIHVAGVWTFLESALWLSTLFPLTVLGWVSGRFLFQRFGFAMLWMLAPTVVCFMWLVAETGFRSPPRWALTRGLRMFAETEAPESATSIKASFGEAMGGDNEYFSFECTPEDTGKLIRDMGLIRIRQVADEPGISPFPEGWEDIRLSASHECYSRQTGAWTYCLWTDPAHRRVLIMMWCG